MHSTVNGSFVDLVLPKIMQTQKTILKKEQG